MRQRAIPPQRSPCQGSSCSSGTTTTASSTCSALPELPAQPGHPTGGQLVLHHFVGRRDQDRLYLGVGLDRGAAALAADAGLLVTAERSVRLKPVAVDAHGSG